MLEKLFKLLGYAKIQPIAEETESPSNEPTLEEHISKITAFHNANFNKIEKAISHTYQELEFLIASTSPKESEEISIRLNTLMLGVWCESRLHKLAYEKDLFSEIDRKFIYSGSNLEDKWKKSLEIALRKNKTLDSDVILDLGSLGFSLFQVYTEIKNWIDVYFTPVIRLRNKVAHSQWVNPFQNYQSGWDSSWSFKLCGESKGLLNRENILTLKYKHELLKRIATAINNLSLVDTEYEVQDFDSMHGDITDKANSLSLLKGIDLKEYRSKLVEKYKYQQENKKKINAIALEKSAQNAIEKLKLKYNLVLK